MLVYFLFVVGFILLIKGADILVSGASSLAKRYGLSDMVVGLTVVSLGTSMPELIVNIMASVQGSSDMAVGNIFGSNIANVLLILGVTAMVHPLPLKKATIFSEIPFAIIATLLVGFLANAALFYEDEGTLMIGRGDGVVLLFYFLLFMVYIFSVAGQDKVIGEEKQGEYEQLSVSCSVLYITGGVFALFLGGKWVVDGAMELARAFGASDSFIGLTVVAVGTSLPELVTSIMAAFRKNVDIAVGNVVGSNIFNVLWILGLSSLIKPLPFDVISNLDIAMIIFSSTLLLVLMPLGRRLTLSRFSGILFVLIYAAYVAYLVYRG